MAEQDHRDRDRGRDRHRDRHRHRGDDGDGEKSQKTDTPSTPQFQSTTPSFGPTRQPTERTPANSAPGPASATPEPASRLHRRRLTIKSRSKGEARHIRLQLQAPSNVAARSSASSVYRGSYGHSPRHSRSSLKTTGSSAPATPRASISQSQLEALLPDGDADAELETYGLPEYRDGFFDGAFLKPSEDDHENPMRDAEYTLPLALKKKHAQPLHNFVSRRWTRFTSVCQALLTTRAGIKLAKSFLAFFLTYVLCLVPPVRLWLGRYNYIMVLSALINHPGRTVGAQLDGVVLTCLGTATGLGVGAFALWVSDSTPTSQRGYGGVLATFLLLFMGVIAAIRSYFIRMYQFVLCAGIAISYAVLAETSEAVHWAKFRDYGVPWALGQAVCLLVCCLVFPDAGARPLAVCLHSAFKVMQDGLVLPQPNPHDVHRELAGTFVDLSQAYRDLALDVSITRFRPPDIMILRNIMQGVIRSLLALKMETKLFDDLEEVASHKMNGNGNGKGASAPSPGKASANGSNGAARQDGEVVINMDNPTQPSKLFRTKSEDKAIHLVVDRLADPTRELLSCLRSSLRRCDAVLMDMSGYRKYLGPPKEISSDIIGALTHIRQASIKYDSAAELLMSNPDLPPTYSNHPGVIELFLFIHPVRQAVTSTERLLVKVMEMQQKHRGWKIYLPSYPIKKAFQRTNAQVRHDRGGVTAGHFFRSQDQLARTMKDMANVYEPSPRPKTENADNTTDEIDDPEPGIDRVETIGKYEEEENVAMNRNSKATRAQRFRYKSWIVIHRLQGFEMRFAFKVAVTTSLLAIPAWLEQSRSWWNENEVWWVVVMVWVMSHPRVGGNIQDLFTRSFCGVLGAVWGGLAYGTTNGNPYIMTLFATIYMLPMLFRFTQSPHPRSGIVGCITFIIISLSSKTTSGFPSIIQISWTRGLAMVVGVISAVVMNWILWPFVARHELRKALSAMLIYESIIYRGVVAKYVYYEKGEEPRVEDIERSEMLEGRLREGFVRIRQLMDLTRHEIRLRAPFNPHPYSELITACEQFFEYLISVRQSSLFFHPHFMGEEDEVAVESLLEYRRNAVASILMNLYVLAGSLRGGRGVPKYLPSAMAARKRLLEHMAILEVEQLNPTTNSSSSPSYNPSSHLQTREDEEAVEGQRLRIQRTVSERRKWSQIYSYSYSQSLTGCVRQLETMIEWTREIFGGVGFDEREEGEEEGESEEEEEEEEEEDRGGPGVRGGY